MPLINIATLRHFILSSLRFIKANLGLNEEAESKRIEIKK